jgi:hypothetical protein
MGTGPMEGRHRDGSKGREVVHVGLGRYFRIMMCATSGIDCVRGGLLDRQITKPGLPTSGWEWKGRRVTDRPSGLLGFGHVKNYDGSRTEWGNKVRAPIEKSV